MLFKFDFFRIFWYNYVDRMANDAADELEKLLDDGKW